MENIENIDNYIDGLYVMDLGKTNYNGLFFQDNTNISDILNLLNKYQCVSIKNVYDVNNNKHIIERNQDYVSDFGVETDGNVKPYLYYRGCKKFKINYDTKIYTVALPYDECIIIFEVVGKIPSFIKIKYNGYYLQPSDRTHIAKNCYDYLQLLENY